MKASTGNRLRQSWTALIRWFEARVDRPWFGLSLFLMGALDIVVPVMPTDVILAAGAAVRPPKWGKYTLWAALGTATGAGLLAFAVQSLGATVELKSVSPELLAKLNGWIARYGVFAVAGTCAIPFPYQPPVYLAALAQTWPPAIFTAAFAGRLLKYGALAWGASRIKASGR